jgi:hypothetical protein
MLVLLDRLKAVEFDEELLPCYRTAQEYWTRHQGSELDLAAAKKNCWAYLARIGTPDDLILESGRRARALLSVLEPRGDERTASLTAEWFADMLYSAPEPGPSPDRDGVPDV